MGDVMRRSGGWSEGDEALLRRLWTEGLPNEVIAARLGRNINAIAVKANRIGLPPKRDLAATTGLGGEARFRPCLRCGSEFLSEHKGHRCCDTCKRSAAWRFSGSYTAAI
jgi:hypothetical protein